MSSHAYVIHVHADIHPTHVYTIRHGALAGKINTTYLFVKITDTSPWSPQPIPALPIEGLKIGTPPKPTAVWPWKPPGPKFIWLIICGYCRDIGGPILTPPIGPTGVIPTVGFKVWPWPPDIPWGPIAPMLMALIFEPIFITGFHPGDITSSIGTGNPMPIPRGLTLTPIPIIPGWTIIWLWATIWFWARITGDWLMNAFGRGPDVNRFAFGVLTLVLVLEGIPTATPPLIAEPPPPEILWPCRTGDLGRRASISDVIGTTALELDNSCLIFPSQISCCHFTAWPPSSPSTWTEPPSERDSWQSIPHVITVIQPRRSDEGRPNISSRRIPRQKFSIKVYISGGFRVGSAESPSQMITSVSREKSITLFGKIANWSWDYTPILQCTNQLSVERRTVPRMPMRQCCFVLVSSEVVGGSVCQNRRSMSMMCRRRGKD